MKITYPYDIEINTPEEAAEYVKHQCDHCPRYDASRECSWDKASKCLDTAIDVIDGFSTVKWQYEICRETPEIMGSGSNYSAIETTYDKAEAFDLLKNSGRNHLERKGKIGTRFVTQIWDEVSEKWEL